MADFKVGRVYKTQCGDSVKITEIKLEGVMPITGRHLDGAHKDATHMWSREGYFSLGMLKHDYTLIEDTTTLSVKVGKTYRARNGNLVKIEKDLRVSGEYTYNGRALEGRWLDGEFVGKGVGHWLEGGKRYLSKEDNLLDLIEEVDGIAVSNPSVKKEQRFRTQCGAIAVILEQQGYSEAAPLIGFIIGQANPSMWGVGGVHLGFYINETWTAPSERYTLTKELSWKDRFSIEVGKKYLTQSGKEVIISNQKLRGTESVYDGLIIGVRQLHRWNCFGEHEGRQAEIYWSNRSESFDLKKEIEWFI